MRTTTLTNFAGLGLGDAQIDNLTSLGYEEMTTIQAMVLPTALEGKDVIAQAKTGSGKTATFALPLLAKLNPRHFGAQALVLCPTRELATQVATEIRRLIRHQQNIKIVILCGGQSIGPQIGSLEHGAHIIVGTPGRIKDHLRKKTLNLGQISTLVLDEADRMLDMGFFDDIESIIKETPKSRQTLLFSATYPEHIETLSGRFQKDPEKISAPSLHEETQLQQLFYLTKRSRKLESLETLLGHYQPESAIVFCHTKDTTREVSAHLKENDIPALALNGDLEQRDRDQVLIQFRQQSCRILVATDVAARGLDINDLPAVINYDLPKDPESYVHRIGRTGRAGKQGLAISLLADRERHKLESIGNFQNCEYDVTPIETLNNKSKMPTPDYVTLCISAGRKEKVRPGDILGALTGDAGIKGSAVGNITVSDYAAFVAVETTVAGEAIKKLAAGKIKGRKFKVRGL